MSFLFDSIFKDGVWLDDEFGTEWLIFDGDSNVEVYRVLKETNTITLEHIFNVPFDDSAEIAAGRIPKTFVEVGVEYIKNLHPRNNEQEQNPG